MKSKAMIPRFYFFFTIFGFPIQEFRHASPHPAARTDRVSPFLGHVHINIPFFSSLARIEKLMGPLDFLELLPIEHVTSTVYRVTRKIFFNLIRQYEKIP